MAEVHQLVKGDYPSGFFDWAVECAPARLEKLRAPLEAAKAAYLEGDPKSLGKALNAYLKAHFTAFDRYRDSTERDG